MKNIMIMLCLLYGMTYGADSVVTVAPSGGNYTTIQAAVTDNEMDIQTVLGDGNNFKIQIDPGWTAITGYDSTGVDIVFANWTADVNNYIIIETDAGARHPGNWDANSYILAVNGRPLRCGVPYTKIYGLQVDHIYDGPNERYAVDFTGDGDSCVFAYSLVKSSATSSNVKMGIHTTGKDTDIYNNIIYDFNDNASDVGIFCNSDLGEVARIIYNTFVNCRYGIWDQTENVNAQNNLFQGCEIRTTSVDFNSATDYNTTDSSSFEYTQATTEDSVDATITFVGGDNYHLGSQQHNNGADLTAIVPDDIDGDSRSPSNSNRGADEVPAAGDTNFVKRIRK